MMRIARAATLLGISISLVASAAAEPTGRSTVDLLIEGGTVFDGDVHEPTQVDVGIRSDRIVFVGHAGKAGIRAKQTLNAQGWMVTPGFIDAHVHAEPELDSSDPGVRVVARQVMQGITTSIIGVDGEGPFEVAARLRGFDRAGTGQNVATYVGFGAIRRHVLGEVARAPTAQELTLMKSLAARGMCEGALGLSSGLFYAPQSFASTDEVIAVAQEAGKRGGLYDTHQRDEGDSTIGVVASLEEAIRIGRESGAPLHLAHIKVAAPSRADGSAMLQLIQMIDAARAAGQPVTADQYPWTAANTGLEAAIIPRWAQDGGREAMLKRFDTPTDAARIREESKVSLALAERLLITSAPGQPAVLGKRLSELATAWGVTPIEAAMRLLKGGEVSAAVFVMAEADIREAMVQPWVMSSSDGRSGGHPRAYASYPKLWTDYVIAQKVLTPMQFVHRSTALAADSLGLKQRGRIRAGDYADVVVIDPARYAPRATFLEPRELTTGVVDVVVNGRIELKDGKLTGVLAGRALRKRPTPGTCGNSARAPS